MNAADTIVALSSAPGSASRAIIRLSGMQAFQIVGQLCDLDRPPRAALLRRSLDLGAGALLPAALYLFPGPRSSTGQDVVELHVPGSPWLVRRSLDRLNELGARDAQPGEFTARGFFNGKLDLSSAEGVAATIGASNRSELDAARSLLAGELARRLSPTLDALVHLLAMVEADVDFVDEDVSILSPDETRRRIDAISDPLRNLLVASPRLERLAHEPRIVLVGRPNAGKSTLLNRLAGQTRAVVSPTAGTTRDALSARVALSGGTITLVDIAGLDESIGTDAIEHQMSHVARDEIERADRVILVADAGDDRPPLDVGRAADLHVETKIDLHPPAKQRVATIHVSASSGDGLEALRRSLDAIAFPTRAHDAAASLALNARHVREIEQALSALGDARNAIGLGVELVASSLRRAVDALGRVLGKVSPDDVLGRIFSSFCIGK